jgi:hypothetical protein
VARVSDRGSRTARKSERIVRQEAKAGIYMGAEKRACLILENVERRAGPRIDFEQRKAAVVDQKIDCVEAAKPTFRAHRRCGVPQMAVHLRRQNCRPQNAAESKGSARCRGRPLTAQANDQRMGSVRNKLNGNGFTLGPALKINCRILRERGGSWRHMSSARTACAFDEPFPVLCRPFYLNLWMRNF